MWYFIARVTDDPTRGGVLRVERYTNDQLETNTEQEDMVFCIQEEMGFRVFLAHSATITTMTVSKKLGYLSNAQVVVALITDEIEIPGDVDNVTPLMLDEISQLDIKLVAGNRDEITVTIDDFKR